MLACGCFLSFSLACSSAVAVCTAHFCAKCHQTGTWQRMVEYQTGRNRVSILEYPQCPSLVPQIRNVLARQSLSWSRRLFTPEYCFDDPDLDRILCSLRCDPEQCPLGMSHPPHGYECALSCSACTMGGSASATVSSSPDELSQLLSHREKLLFADPNSKSSQKAFDAVRLRPPATAMFLSSAAYPRQQSQHPSHPQQPPSPSQFDSAEPDSPTSALPIDDAPRRGIFTYLSTTGFRHRPLALCSPTALSGEIPVLSAMHVPQQLALMASGANWSFPSLVTCSQAPASNGSQLHPAQVTRQSHLKLLAGLKSLLPDDSELYSVLDSYQWDAPQQALNCEGGWFVSHRPRPTLELVLPVTVSLDAVALSSPSPLQSPLFRSTLALTEALAQRLQRVCDAGLVVDEDHELMFSTRRLIAMLDEWNRQPHLFHPDQPSNAKCSIRVDATNFGICWDALGVIHCTNTGANHPDMQLCLDAIQSCVALLRPLCNRLESIPLAPQSPTAINEPKRTSFMSWLRSKVRRPPGHSASQAPIPAAAVASPSAAAAPAAPVRRRPASQPVSPRLPPVRGASPSARQPDVPASRPSIDAKLPLAQPPRRPASCPNSPRLSVSSSIASSSAIVPSLSLASLPPIAATPSPSASSSSSLSKLQQRLDELASDDINPWSTFQQCKKAVSQATRTLVRICSLQSSTVSTDSKYCRFRFVCCSDSTDSDCLSITGLELFGRVFPPLQQSDEALAQERGRHARRLRQLSQCADVFDTNRLSPSLEVSSCDDGQVVINRGNSKWRTVRVMRRFAQEHRRPSLSAGDISTDSNHSQNQQHQHTDHRFAFRILSNPFTQNTWRFCIGVISDNFDWDGKNWVGAQPDSYSFIAANGGICTNSGSSSPCLL